MNGWEKHKSSSPNAVLLVVAVLLGVSGLPLASVHGDLQSPDWWDHDGVGTFPDWHYRVPVTIAAGSYPNSTIRIDVDFDALLSQMGADGTFDRQSPRVVNGSGELIHTQQYTDTVYGGASDAMENGRGEIRFLLQDIGPATYYIYFDILENGAKPAWPVADTINGNFEFSSDEQQDPPGWDGRDWSTFNAFAIANEYNLTIATNFGFPINVVTDETSHTGQYCYLVGARERNEAQSRNPSTRLEREISAPSGNPGVLQLRYRVKGWDSSADGNDQRDFIRIQLLSGDTVVADLVGPDAGNYTRLPYSPNLGIGMMSFFQSGYGQYNGWDTDVFGNHHSGMNIEPGTEPWFTARVDLSAYAGQSLTLRIETRNTRYCNTWFHIDDVEWSVVEAQPGTPQSFGVDITMPDSNTVYSYGDTLAISTRVDAGAGTISADLYNPAGDPVADGILLFNDGTHGDAVAGDGLWANDGSVAEDITYVFSAADMGGTRWQVVVTAEDSRIAVTDSQWFTLSTPPDIMLIKTVRITSDPVNGEIHPKAIPGALVEYTIMASNQGGTGMDADTMVVTNAIPADTVLMVTDRGQPGGPVAFFDGDVPSGLTFDPAGDLEFSSDDGSTFDLDVGDLSADADGCDSRITHFRINPKGVFAGAANGNSPRFALQFRVRVE